MTKLGTIVAIRGKGNFIPLGTIEAGEFVQISWANAKDDELESEGTYEVDSKESLKDFVTNLAKEHQFVLVAVQ